MRVERRSNQALMRLVHISTLSRLLLQRLFPTVPQMIDPIPLLAIIIEKGEKRIDYQLLAKELKNVKKSRSVVHPPDIVT